MRVSIKGPLSHEVIELAATGQLGIAAAAQIQLAVCTTRRWAAMPRNSNTGSSTSASAVAYDPPAACRATVSSLSLDDQAGDASVTEGEPEVQVDDAAGEVAFEVVDRGVVLVIGLLGADEFGGVGVLAG